MSRSPIGVHESTYWLSSSIQCSNETSLRPLICHRQVMPWNAQAAQRDGVVVRYFAGQSRARTDQRHIAEHDVDEVRQFVDARAPQKTAERMKPRIVADLKDGTVDFVEVHDAVAQRVRAVDHRTKH